MDSTQPTPPLVIEVKLRYESASEPVQEKTFWYLNNGERTAAEYNKLFIAIQDRGPLIAAQYGLPQLSPVLTAEQSDAKHHPYSTLLALRPHSRLPDDADVHFMCDIGMFEPIFVCLENDVSCQSYLSKVMLYRKHALQRLFDEFSVHYSELQGNPQALLEIENEVKRIAEH